MRTHGGQVRAGDWLRTLFDKAGLSQRQVARRLDVTDPAVSSWVHGTHTPRDWEGLERLLQSEGVDIPTGALKTLWEPGGPSPELTDSLARLGIRGPNGSRRPRPEPETSSVDEIPEQEEAAVLGRPDSSRPRRTRLHRRYLAAAVGMACLLVVVVFLSARSEPGSKGAPADPSTTAPGPRNVEAVSQPVGSVADANRDAFSAPALWSQCKADDVHIRSAPGAVVDASTPQINRGEVFAAEALVSTGKGPWLRGHVRDDPSRYGYVPTNFFCKV